MQRDLASMLNQKSRLAALGLAVSKINHDLRNLLTSAQLFSEGLSSLPDPRVQRFAPKLMRSLERAIDLCQSTLSYGRAREQPPARRDVELAQLVEELRESLGIQDEPRIGWIVSIERGMTVDADPEQLLRVLLNLARNAQQALEAERDPTIRCATRSASPAAARAPSPPSRSPIPARAFPATAREHLFEAFQSTTRTGGAGLGLAIAAELVRAHGGDIALIDGPIGATFRITIPDRAVQLDVHRTKRQRA